MIRKFECWNCKHTFEADNSRYVECPYCQSDNVEYSTYHAPKYFKWIIGLLFLVGLVLFVHWQFSSNNTNCDEEILWDENLVQSEEIIIGEEEFSDIQLLKNPPKITTGKLKFEDDGYSVKVSVQNMSSGQYHFAILNAFEDVVIAESSNGVFKKVPYSEAEGGSYRIAIIQNSNDSIITFIDVPGFIKQVRVSSKMSLEELQRLIYSRDQSLLGLGKNDYLSPDYKLNFVGLASNSTQVPSVLAEVFEKLDMGAWESVSITNVEYDENNRIRTITMSVQMIDDDF